MYKYNIAMQDMFRKMEFEAKKKKIYFCDPNPLKPYLKYRPAKPYQDHPLSLE